MLLWLTGAYLRLRAGISRVGKSSIEMLVNMEQCDAHGAVASPPVVVARGLSVMVFVRYPPGVPVEVSCWLVCAVCCRQHSWSGANQMPAAVRDAASSLAITGTAPVASRALVTLRGTHAVKQTAASVAQLVVAQQDMFVYCCRARVSDEDLNRHVNQSYDNMCVCVCTSACVFTTGGCCAPGTMPSSTKTH